ncbi:hypothetical protein FSP39_013066 [Pinctada imbricata]|uniref:Uncharacterized protein n=1 Tax=Pinctada imbricata TaxID=66713 RepID=A0AA89BSR9_PINIB|nr:hypothetical protein FSP39_013066 [Pinctada imbricata]
MTEPEVTPRKPVSDHWKTKYRMVTSIDDLRSLRFWKAVAAEFVGTLLLVFVGCGSCIQWVKDTDVVQISLCFGLSVATIVWIIGHVSGGHINPAVTTAFFITRRISLARAVMYIVSQCVGAIIGAGILKGVTPPGKWGSLGATLLHEEMDGGKAFGVELFITIVLVLTVFATCDKRRKDLNGSFPLSIGLSITMCHLFAVRYTGASMNTARSFGPAVVMAIWTDHWVYWLGPLLGGIIAGLLYDNTFAVNASLEKARGFLLSSDYDTENFPPKKSKIKIIEEEAEAMNITNITVDSAHLVEPKHPEPAT